MDRSVDSIGSCSLDVDADSTDFSDTSGELNFLTPISGKDITREFTAGIKERCMLPVINCQAVTSVLDPATGHISTVLTTTASPNAQQQQQQQPLLGGGGDCSPTTAVTNKKPSYLNLACCVNGYSNLTTYDSKLRQDINKSREVSPSRPIIATLHYNRTDSAGGGHLLTAPTLSYVSMNNTINNNNYNASSTTATIGGTRGMLKMNGAGGRMRGMNVSIISPPTGGGGVADMTDNGLFNGNGSFAGGMRTKVISSQSQISSHMRGDDAQLMTPKKSFIQQRVEKLYGASDVVVLNKQNYSSSERKYLNNIANDNGGSVGGGTPVKLVQHHGGSVTTGPIGNGTARNGVANGGGILYAANGGGATNGSSFVHVDENNRQINGGGGGGERSQEGGGEEADVDSLPVLRHLRPEFRAQLQIFSPKKMPKQSPTNRAGATAAAAATGVPASNGNATHANGNTHTNGNTDHFDDLRINGSETNRSMISTMKSTRSSSHATSTATTTFSTNSAISAFSSTSNNGHHASQHEALIKSSSHHHSNATSTRSVETTYQTIETVQHQEERQVEAESHSVSSSTAADAAMVTTVEEKMRTLVVVSPPSNAGGDSVGRMSTADGGSRTSIATVAPIVAVPDGEQNPVTVASTSVIENGVRKGSSGSSKSSSSSSSSSTGHEQISTLSAAAHVAERSASECGGEIVTCDNIPSAETTAQSADNMRTATNGDTAVVVDGNASVHSFAQQRQNVDEIDRAVPATSASLIEATTNGSTISANNNNAVVLDGNYFLQILKTEQNRLRTMADEVEKEINQIKADGVELGEDVNGYILAAVGKARLLCSQKMKQFEDLCYTNLNQSPDEKFQTTGEDLRGFWDMVMLQVNNVDASFAEIDSFRKNDWRKPIPKSPQPARNGSATATRTKLVKRPYKTQTGGSTVTDGSNGGVEAKKASAALAAAKREAQRKQLMEMKRKQKLAAAAASQQQQTAVEIFAPSNAADGSMTNGEDKTSYTPSAVGVSTTSAALVDTS
uniref:Guanylate-kinase-associated protein n=1 Tax=Anopheles farauti TaxID=69004 RepID=A0A182QR28_9DIPT